MERFLAFASERIQDRIRETNAARLVDLLQNKAAVNDPVQATIHIMKPEVERFLLEPEDGSAKNIIPRSGVVADLHYQLAECLIRNGLVNGGFVAEVGRGDPDEFLGAFNQVRKPAPFYEIKLTW
jgi:hypothetical protein